MPLPHFFIMDLKIKNYPKHLGLIPDGCRRWATERDFKPWKGHEKGIEVMENIGKWSFKNLPIKYYTVYGLSLENLKRSNSLLNMLFDLYSEHFLKLAEDDVIHEEEVNVGAVGRLDLLPEKLLDAISTAEEKTKDYDNKHFQVALGYSGRAEIVDAVKKASKKGEITEEAISKDLYSSFPDVDLIIRTSEKRLSNFLLWEGAYSEFCFVDKYWPAFTREDYIEALKDFDERKRRYGE